MVDKSIPVDTGPLEGGKEVEQRKECYRCGNLYPADKLRLLGYLCDSCFADLQELGRTYSQSEYVQSRGTVVYRFTNADGILFWAMYSTNGDDIRDIAKNFERNLIPVNVWEIQMEQKTSYLLTIGNLTDRSVPVIMDGIAPHVLITNFKRIVDWQTPYQMAAGRGISDFILGRSCGNRLEMTFREMGEMMLYASDLEEAGIHEVEIIEKMLTKFYFSDPITRKAAFIGRICSLAPDEIKKAKDQGLDPQE